MINDDLYFKKIENPEVYWNAYQGYEVITSFGMAGYLHFQQTWHYEPIDCSVLLTGKDLKKITKKLKKLNRGHDVRTDLGST